jgi:surface antigen
MKSIKLAVAAMAVFALAACAGNGAGPKEGIGTLLGAVVGGVAGSQVGSGRGQLVATGVGTLLGAYLGNEIGKSLDRADQLYMQQAEQQALVAPVGDTIAWSNPDSGNSGTVTPVREGTHRESGEYCREFQQTVTVGGRNEEAYGTACRQADGTWQIVGG